MPIILQNAIGVDPSNPNRKPTKKQIRRNSRVSPGNSQGRTKVGRIIKKLTTPKKKMQAGGVYGNAGNPSSQYATAAGMGQGFAPKLNPEAAKTQMARRSYQQKIAGEGMDRDQQRSMMKTYDTQNNTPTGMRYQKGGKTKGGGGAKAGRVPGMGMTKIKKKLSGLMGSGMGSSKIKSKLAGLSSKKARFQEGGKVQDYDVIKAYKDSQSRKPIPPKPGGAILGPKPKPISPRSKERDMIQEYKDMIKKPVNPGRGGYIPGPKPKKKAIDPKSAPKTPKFKGAVPKRYK